jgi:Fe-S cluster biogenesis protein NfuA
MMPFSDEDIYQAVEHNLPKTTEYVKSHGGGIKLICVKDGKVYIQLTGTCHGCSMSLMTTKMVVQRELRALIHPELEVVNVDGTPENEPPEDCYKPQKEEPEEEEKKEGLMDKVKKTLSI